MTSKYTLQVQQDECPMNPRTDMEPIGTLCVLPNKYSHLGDNEEFLSEWNGLQMQSVYGLPILEQAKHYAREVCGVVGELAICEVYGYSHGSLVLSTTPFSCRFDSGLFGFIFAQVEEGQTEEQVLGWLQEEIDTYSAYLQGDVYEWAIEKDGECVESCSGYYCEEEAQRDGEAWLDTHKQMEKAEQKHFDSMKTDEEIKAYLSVVCPSTKIWEKDVVFYRNTGESCLMEENVLFVIHSQEALSYSDLGLIIEALKGQNALIEDGGNGGWNVEII